MAVVDEEVRPVKFPLLQIFKAFFFRRLDFKIDLIPFEFRGLPYKKIFNWLKTESSVLFKPSRPWGFPTVIQIEPTTQCNLACSSCPVARDLSRPRGSMGLAEFKSLIDQLKDYLLVILFWDWGEPFLNPDAYKMISYAREAGIKVMASTNGHGFAENNHARQVVAAGLDVLTFSVDGINQDSYQQFRRKGSLAQVQEGIRNVAAAKKNKKSPLPLINLRYIVMKHNEAELSRLPEFSRSLPIDILTVRKFHAVPYDKEGWQAAKSMVPEQGKYQLPRLSRSSGEPERVAKNPCKNLWNCPTVHWDGKICRCFMDYSEKFVLGDLKKQSFKAIWYGPEYHRVRRRFRNKWQDLELCNVCSSGFAGGDVGREANVEKLEF